MSFARSANIDRDMLNAGNDIVPERNVSNRQKRGECVTCGNQLFKVGKFLGKKVPLTVEGKVLKGRCLTCKPLEGYMRKPAPPIGTTSPAAAVTSPTAKAKVTTSSAVSSPAPAQQSQQSQQQSPPTSTHRKPPKSPTQPPRSSGEIVVPTQAQVHAAGPPLELQVGQNPHLVQQQQQQQQPQQFHVHNPMIPPHQHQQIPPDITPHELHMHQMQMQQYQSAPFQQQPMMYPPQHFHQQQHQYPQHMYHPQMMPMHHQHHHQYADQQVSARMMNMAAAYNNQRPLPPRQRSSAVDGQPPNFVGTTLEVPIHNDLGDDVSVVSGITMDVRLFSGSDDGPGPTIRRRPGPENGDGEDVDRKHASRTNIRTLPSTNRSMRRFRDAVPATLPEDEGVQSSDHHVDNGDSSYRNRNRRKPRSSRENLQGTISEEVEVTTGLDGIEDGQPGNRKSSFDADGYPVSSNSFGWDRQADMLPPGGNIDALLSSPRPQSKVVSSAQTNTEDKDPIAEEIQFSPPTDFKNDDNADGNAYNERKLEVDSFAESFQPPEAKFRESGGRSPRGQEPPKLPMRKSSFRSLISGPSYQSDGVDDNPHHDQPAAAPPEPVIVGAPSGRKFEASQNVVHLPPSSSQLRGRPSLGTTVSDSTPPLMTSRGRADSARGISDPSAFIPAVMPEPLSENSFEESGTKSRNDEDEDGLVEIMSASLASSVGKGHVNANDEEEKQQEQLSQEDKKTSSAAIPRPLSHPSSGTQLKAPPSRTGNGKQNHGEYQSQRIAISQVSDIIQTLSLGSNGTISPSVRENALQDLSNILYSSGPKDRESIVEQKCVEILTSAMWTEIDNPHIQNSALQCILAMAASPDGKATSDMLANQDSVCDAVLFSMQMHSSDPEIQLRGCNIFACLASASSENRSMSDGSLSGAVAMVVNAMAIHSSTVDIQKAGIKALYNQCFLSLHAEANKRSLISTKAEDGLSGVGILLRCIELCHDDCLTVELACRVFWCLTSSQDLWKAIVPSEINDLRKILIPVYQEHLANPRSNASLVEATNGIIGNFAKDETTHAELRNANAVKLVMDSIRCHPGHDGVQKEALLAIANLCTSEDCRDDIVGHGVLNFIFKILGDDAGEPESIVDALRAVIALASTSALRKSIFTKATLVIIDRLITECNNATVLEICCALISKMTLDSELVLATSENDVIEMLRRAIDQFQEEKVTKTALLAFRNMSCCSPLIKPLVESDAISTVVNAMEKYPKSDEIQRSACFFLWNVAQKGVECHRDEVELIVKAMQSHLELADLLESACGTLWSIVEHSANGRKHVIESGAIEVLASIMMMHPDTTTTLQQACGVLSNISTDIDAAQAIVDAQGVNIVAETMRNNNAATELLEIGCLTLRNLIYAFPDRSDEAGIAIATVINAMQKGIDSVSFHREACNLIWILTYHSSENLSKVLALDGLTILMKSMEQYSDDEEIQQAALAAFNQLTLSAQEC